MLAARKNLFFSFSFTRKSRFDLKNLCAQLGKSFRFFSFSECSKKSFLYPFWPLRVLHFIFSWDRNRRTWKQKTKGKNNLIAHFDFFLTAKQKLSFKDAFPVSYSLGKGCPRSFAFFRPIYGLCIHLASRFDGAKKCNEYNASITSPENDLQFWTAILIWDGWERRES